MLKRLKYFLNSQKGKIKWTSLENEKLLALQSIHLNKWKIIAGQFTGKTGGQIKNQFFNLIRTLLRKAFKIMFKKSETGVISEIKPKVLSDLVNRRLESFMDDMDQMSKVSVKDFLADFVSKKWVDGVMCNNSKRVLEKLRWYMLKLKYFKK